MMGLKQKQTKQPYKRRIMLTGTAALLSGLMLTGFTPSSHADEFAPTDDSTAKTVSVGFSQNKILDTSTSDPVFTDEQQFDSIDDYNHSVVSSSDSILNDHSSYVSYTTDNISEVLSEKGFIIQLFSEHNVNDVSSETNLPSKHYKFSMKSGDIVSIYSSDGNLLMEYLVEDGEYDRMVIVGTQLSENVTVKVNDETVSEENTVTFNQTTLSTV